MGLKLVNSCHREHSHSLNLFPLPAVSGPATLLINIQGSLSDIQWPAWVSPAQNNKLFGFEESGLYFTAAQFSQWPHCSIWRELWLKQEDVVRAPTLRKYETFTFSRRVEYVKDIWRRLYPRAAVLSINVMFNSRLMLMKLWPFLQTVQWHLVP